MKSKITRTLLIFLFFAQETSHAQSVNFRNYQVENGLSYNSVISSMQDKKGFMWFGTKDGLNRFDGNSFKVFRHNPNQAGTIGNNFIQCLYEDADENIWVGTLDGLYRYDPFKETFIFIAHTRNRIIRDIKGDKDANIWYIESGTICRYNKENNHVTTYGGQANFLCTSIAITEGNQIYVATENGFVQRYDVKNNRFISYPVFDNSNRPMSKRIEKIYDTGSDLLLVGTLNQGLKLFNTRTNSYQDVSLTDADARPISIRDFIASSPDEYWIASESGIFIYNIRTGKYQNLRHQFNDPYSISDNAVYTLTRDREGGLWAGTYFGGINYFPKQYTPFEKYFPQAGKQSLTGKAVREICSDMYGNIWIGTEDAGLHKFDAKSGNFKPFRPNGGHTSNLHSNIHGLLAVKNELWIGTFEHGLDVMDIPSSKIIRSYRSSQLPTALKSNFIECLLQTVAGEILIGTSAGLYRYDRKGDDFQLLNEVPGNLHYTALMEDKNGNIWAGTLRDGLYHFNPVSGRHFSYKHELNNPESLSSNYINGLFQASDGTIWVTTESGLLKLNEDFKRFTRYVSKDGFPSDVFYNILEGAKHQLWISTSKGLVKFDYKANKIRIFTRANGTLSDQFNYSSAFREQNGRMHFGSVSGLIRFDPKQFQENRHPAPLFITGFQVNNKELTIKERGSPLTKSINSTDRITLSYDQSTFSIDFAALSYTAPEITEYAYILEGLEKSWTYLKRNRKVYFTQLLPGTYTFKLKAANSSGNWNDRVKTLTITIRPPFWASIWAFLVYFGLLLAGLYYGIRYYNKWLHRRNEIRIERWEAQKDKELYQAKINFFTYVTHEIRTPLTLIKGPLEDIIKKTADNADLSQDIFIMQKNTDRLLDLTDQLLDFRKTESEGFSLNFINCDINKVVLDNFIRFKSAAEDRGLKTTINLPETPTFAYADPEALNKILSNLIDNASKYAGSEICIQLTVQESTFSIQVSSDGNKIHQSLAEKIFEPFYRINDHKLLKGSGIGLPLARSLSELHEGTLTLSSADNDWNTFILSLPTHHAQEFKLPDLQDESNFLLKEKMDSRVGTPIILLVEDNPEISTFISSKLVSEYKVLQASNGEEALSLLNCNHIQLIISDIMMPLLNGIDLCQKLKNDLEFAHIPIILLTAKNTIQSKIEGLEAGADAYLEKPFSPEHLLTQISNLLVSREKIKSYFAKSPLVHIKSMAYNKSDEVFLEKLNECIKQNIDNSALDVDFLANAMYMSKPTLYRKIKAISDLTPHELINITRLKSAAELLLEGRHKILKIASMTGFSSQAQFSRSFAKQFGMTPSEYAASVKVGKDR